MPVPCVIWRSQVHPSLQGAMMPTPGKRSKASKTCWTPDGTKQKPLYEDTSTFQASGTPLEEKIAPSEDELPPEEELFKNENPGRPQRC